MLGALVRCLTRPRLSSRDVAEAPRCGGRVHCYRIEFKKRQTALMNLEAGSEASKYRGLLSQAEGAALTSALGLRTVHTGPHCIHTTARWEIALASALVRLPKLQYIYTMELLSIPSELISRVLQCLSHVDLLRCSMANQFLHSLVMECEEAWKKLFYASFGSAGVQGSTWRAGFRARWVGAMRECRLKRKLKSERLAASMQVRYSIYGCMHGPFEQDRLDGRLSPPAAWITWAGMKASSTCGQLSL